MPQTKVNEIFIYCTLLGFLLYREKSNALNILLYFDDRLWAKDKAGEWVLCLTWMCCCVMSQGLCASSLLSVCRLRSLVGACSRPLSQLSSPPASRKPALCCCTRYRHWCRAAAWETSGWTKCQTKSHPLKTKHNHWSVYNNYIMHKNAGGEWDTRTKTAASQ